MKRFLFKIDAAAVLCALLQNVSFAEAVFEKTETALRTEDSVEISVESYSREGSESVVIVCPGFYNSMKNRWMQKAAELVRGSYDVMIFDFSDGYSFFVLQILRNRRRNI